MESTGSYWIPVKNVLESDRHVVLVCSKKHHRKKGEKTDFPRCNQPGPSTQARDADGKLSPERRVVELRDLTRRRKKLQGHLTSEKNRIQKTPGVANVKIGNVVSDVFGVSGQAMLDVLLSGRKAEADEIAQLAKCRLRSKIPATSREASARVVA